MNAQELRHRAARGEVLTPAELLEVVEALESKDRRNQDLINKNLQLEAKVGVLTGMNALAFEAANSHRTIDDIREEVIGEGTKRHSHLYNAFEIRQCIYALDGVTDELAALRVAYNQIDVESCTARTPEQILTDLADNKIGPFSFKEVTALANHFGDKPTLTRPVKKNIREVFDLLKAQPTALFYGEEVRMIRKWGTDHDRNLSIVKTRLGRAFTDPVGYMDKRFDLMLTKDTKRQLLDGRILSAHAYQDAVFSRPDFLRVKADWKLYDGKTQFHAGEHFHTRACDGMWWCGTQFNDLTGHQLMNILETALGELRLLYIHFPNGVQNEASEQIPSAS